MLDILVKWLNDFSAGDALLAIVVVCWAVTKVWTPLSKLREKTRDNVKNDINKNEEHQKILTDIKTVKQECLELQKATQELSNEFKSLTENSTSDDGKLANSIQSITQLISDQDTRIGKIESNVRVILDTVDEICAADGEVLHAYLTEQYEKYVISEKKINLITLQNIEKLYNRYQSAVGEDEFITRVMNEIRALPTSKD
jgi:F0F1-type ATP synthase membrane subunit b/b'